MAWIQVIKEQEAQGELAALYPRMKDVDGKVANILLVHSLNPAVLRAHYELYKACMYGPSELTRAQREMVAVAVSGTNRCRYCVTHHADSLRRVVKDDSLVEAVKRDYASAPVDAKEKALMDFAVKLTRESSACTEADILQLRQAGWSDRAILEVTVVAAYFNFVNRIANGLGVTLEARWPDADAR